MTTSIARTSKKITEIMISKIIKNECPKSKKPLRKAIGKKRLLRKFLVKAINSTTWFIKLGEATT